MGGSTQTGVWPVRIALKIASHGALPDRLAEPTVCNALSSGERWCDAGYVQATLLHPIDRMKNENRSLILIATT